MSRSLLATTVASLLLFAAGFPAAASDTLDLATYLDTEQVSDPQLSPDGKRIVYTRRYVDKVEDSWESSIWIMNADGTRNRHLLDGSSPRWSPDGTRLAYLAEGDPAGSQIFVRWMDAEGGTTQITRVEKDPSNLRWSPDGDTIAFVMLQPKENDWKIEMPKAPEGAKWTKAPRIVESMTYRRDRQGFVEEGYRHIFTTPAGGGTARQLTEGDYHHGQSGISWTPDGREILFSAVRDDDWEYAWRESDVYAVRLADRSVRQLTTRKGPDTQPEVSPDGQWVAYTGYDYSRDTYIDSRLHLMSIDGTGHRVLSAELDRSPNDLRWADDGSGIYFNVSDSGTRNLYFASTDGELNKVTDGTHLLSISSIQGNRAVGTCTSFHQPGDIVSVDLPTGATRQLTHVNDDILEGIELGDVEEIWYDSLDDYKIQGWIVKPPNFDPTRKYPMMLAIHGGPHGMYGVGFNFGWQNHAANGYVVLYTNPRGSSGYGSDFGNAIKWAYPSKDYDDLMAGVDTVIGRGYIDTERLFVYGCSGGGVLTAWVVGHTDRFAAASSNCPVTNWLSFVGTTDGPNHWYRNFEKNFWEDPSEHLRRSPIMYVGNVTTPTMLMTGVKDLRTPMSQTEEYYQALKMRRVPTAMVRFNEEFHGTSSKPSNFLRTQLYLRYWFEKHAPDEEGERATEATGAL